jgi:hypothetical protein
MTWRIEHTDALTLLRELPDEWVQTCIALPPCGVVAERTLAILAETHRVLRRDGALWLFLPNEGLRDALHGLGWVEQRLPSWAAPTATRRSGVRPLALLTPEESYFHRSTSFAPQTPRAFRPRRPGWYTEPAEQGRDAIRGLAGRFVLTTTAQLACGACGQPYRRGPNCGKSIECGHHDPTGRCLVLDPFYRASNGTLEAADRNRRHFLGVVDAKRGDES